MKATIVHVPKGFSAEDWSHNFINFMPMGTYSVANYANARGHEVTILNTSVYGSTEAAFDRIFAEISRTGALVVGMPLHWHLAGADVLFVAGKIKERCPDVKIVLGGITASIFGEDLLRESSAIDAVVHGDGEEPFARYLSEIARGDAADLSVVPNLRYRRGSDIAYNGLSYVASQDEYSALDYGISKTVTDLTEYTNGPSMIDAVAGRSFDLRKEPIERKMFFVNLGRGCSYDCVYCAGCRESFAAHFARPKAMARPVDAVLRTMKDAYSLGFRRYHFCWDCAYPHRNDRLIELFRRAGRELGDDLAVLYEAYLPPDREFLQAASESFQQTSLILSPNFFSYETMRRYMGYAYTFEAMEACLREMAIFPNIVPLIFFGITPLEDWSPAGRVQKVNVMRRLKDRYGCRVSPMPIYAEPGSPWVSFPGVFNNHMFPFTFADFLAEWRKPLAPWNDRLTGMKDIAGIVREVDEQMAIDKMTEV